MSSNFARKSAVESKLGQMKRELGAFDGKNIRMD